MRNEIQSFDRQVRRSGVALSRMVLACGFVVTILASAGGIVNAKEAPGGGQPPNFVLIFIDDMGYGDIEPFGSTANRTPNLNRMAAEGMKLTSFYAAPVCSASRAQLLTGCYAPRVSVPGVFFPAGSRGLNPTESTVADYLHELGYATMCVGKWHLGDQREFLPLNNGFDGYFGIPYSNDMGRTSLETGRSVHPLVRDGQVAELLENEGQRRITREYTEEAIKFIESNAAKPFFLYLPHTAMHVPLFPHEDFAGKSQNGTYGDWVAEVDWSVGQILETLRRLKIDRKTLVVFTSDNGPWASKGKAGGVAGPLRGSKGCTLEGGVREPTIAWWPGQIEAASSCDAVAGTTDILPTFVSLAGGKPRGEVKIDGHDIAPLLRGQAREIKGRIWFYYNGTQLKAVRQGPWKLAVARQSLGMGIGEKPADLQSAEPRLYNLDEEIGETTNVAAQHPEVVARLSKLVAAMAADIGSGKPGPGVRPAGVVEHPVMLFPTVAPNRNKPISAAHNPGKPIDWQQVKIGDSYPPNFAPKVKNKHLSIECIVAGKQPHGVILAHGGTAVGYALYVKNGQAVFATRHNADLLVRVSQALGEGETRTISAGLTADGTVYISVNGREFTNAESPGMLTREPQEDFCVGHDNAHPVDSGVPDGRFSGEIKKLAVNASDTFM